MIKISHTNKPTRSKAFELVSKLHAGEQLDSYETSALVMFFAPSTPSKPKTVIDWVKRVVAKKTDPREYLRYVWVIDGVMIASDGQRLHWYNIHGLYADGAYEPKTMAQVDDIWSTYEQTMQRAKLNFIDNANLTGKWVAPDEPVDAAVWMSKDGKTTVASVRQNGIRLNVNYRNEAMGFHGGGGDLEVFADLTAARLVGQCDGAGFVVMGVRE